jgi:hypothetical protein
LLFLENEIAIIQTDRSRPEQRRIRLIDRK